MDDKFKNIEMLEFERSECKPENPIKSIFEESDNFNFTIKLSARVPKEWADIFKREIPSNFCNLNKKTAVHDDKITIGDVPFSSFKDIAERYKVCIGIANSEYSMLFSKQKVKNAIIQKKLDDLVVEVFNKSPDGLRVRVL